MGMRYSEAFIEQALFKVYSRGKRTVKSVAGELNVNCHTEKNWMKRKETSAAGVPAAKERRPQDWTAEQQLVALHETHGLTGELLQTWCRENGLFAHHLASWKAAFCADTKLPSSGRDIRVVGYPSIYGNATIMKWNQRTQPLSARLPKLGLIIRATTPSFWRGFRMMLPALTTLTGSAGKTDLRAHRATAPKAGA